MQVGDLVKYRTRKNAYRTDERGKSKGYVGVVTEIKYSSEVAEHRFNDHQTHAVLWIDLAIVYWENPGELELINEEN